jgi:dihydroorotate dehydrogenase
MVSPLVIMKNFVIKIKNYIVSFLTSLLGKNENKFLFFLARNYKIGFLYRNILKRLFFRIDEEKMHNRIIMTGRILGNNVLTRKIVSLCLNFSNPALKQKIRGITFKNPIGLAAGFDKNAELTKIMPSVGFGFMEVGSITGEPCEGNPKPRLWRLPKSRSIVVYYGLKNDGCEAISKKLKGKKFKIPVGVSVAKTNSLETSDFKKGIQDYVKAARAFLDIGDYFTVNISCPNAYGGQPFTNPDLLELLLKEINKLNITKPVFLKISPDLPSSVVDEIIKLADRHRVSGFICANLTKNRNNPKIVSEEINRVPEGKGGISGKPAEDAANRLISYIYKKTGGKYVIIGCGGIFNAEDAYKKIKLGASLLQMITGMIFEGPQVISQINLGLCELLKKDGFENISEAVGADLK